MEFCSVGRLLGFKVSADKPGVDGFEVENLITASQQGFVCESFVRPPVSIRFDFSLPLDIAHINLETELRERRSNGFKVFTLVNRRESCITQCSTSSSSSKEGVEEFYLGNWFSVTQKKIILKNYNYKHWFPLPPPLDMTKTSSEVIVGALRNTNRKAFNCVNSLVITITGVQPTGPPVLKAIQIFGQPAFSSSPSERNKIIHLWNKREELFPICTTHSSGMYTSKSVEEKKRHNILQNSSSSDCNIPEEFLDPLTYEIMKLPILLPSGNSVDLFSLEKFISEEAKWGRPPSDPFTGVRFKENFKPEPNVHLKARIARFLLVEKNIHSYTNPGGHILTDRHDSSKEKIPLLSATKKQKTTDGGLACDRSLNRVVTIHPFDSTKQRSCISSPPAASTSAIGRSLTQYQEQNNLQPLHRLRNERSSSFSSRGRHGLVRTLGAALGSTSKRRSSFLSFPSPSPHQGNETSIEQYSLLEISLNPLQCPCGNRVGPFYSPGCSHAICSGCVRQKTSAGNDIQCGKCSHKYNKHQLNRVHPKSAFAS